MITKLTLRYNKPMKCREISQPNNKQKSSHIFIDNKSYCYNLKTNNILFLMENKC